MMNIAKDSTMNMDHSCGLWWCNPVNGPANKIDVYYNTSWMWTDLNFVPSCDIKWLERV